MQHFYLYTLVIPSCCPSLFRVVFIKYPDTSKFREKGLIQSSVPGLHSGDVTAAVAWRGCSQHSHNRNERLCPAAGLAFCILSSPGSLCRECGALSDDGSSHINCNQDTPQAPPEALVPRVWHLTITLLGCPRTNCYQDSYVASKHAGILESCSPDSWSGS